MNDDDHETYEDFLDRLEEYKYSWIQTGVLIDYHSIINGPVTISGMVVREPAQQLHNGLWVCWLEGKAGCVSCEAVTPTALNDAE